ncbi:MAG TPA: hypothetical protein VN478_01500 [Clostridia bacterium]|nr:hypothetical protein [Clostridia bacterium]
MTSDRFSSLHITIPDLRGMLPGVETGVSTAFWVPLAEFVLHRSETFEVVCQREDTDAIKLLMPVAEMIERRHEDGALMFWGAVTPTVSRAVAGGHGSGHESLWWWQMALTSDGNQVFALQEYGERMDVYGLTADEAAAVLELLPFSARIVRTMEAAGTR